MATGAAPGFVLGWEGDDEEVDIGGSDDDGAVISSAPTAAAAPAAAPAAPLVDSRGAGAGAGENPSSSAIFRGEEIDCRPRRKDFELGKEIAGRASNANGNGKAAASIKGKEPAVEEEGASKKRRLESPSSWEHKRKKADDWRSSQWVACVLCKKWRRIPFEQDIERATWQCRDNVWNLSFARCDIPQEEPNTFDNMRTKRVDLPNPLRLSVRKASSPSDKASTPASGSCDDGVDKAAAATPVAAENHSAAIPVADVAAPLCEGCGLGGETIVCCSTGCSSRYHARCLIPKGSRCCRLCKSKYPEVESIWLFKGDYAGGEKMYQVKWKGRAHVHNAVLGEAAVTALAPKKMARLKKNGKLVDWQPLWIVPERIFGMRRNQSQQIEWLVKWSGLGYDRSTWECSSTGVLAEEKGRMLIKLYESWCDVARQRARCSQSQQVSGQCTMLDEPLPSPLQPRQLEMLKNLRECWCQRREGVVLSAPVQEETIPIISFSISLFRELSAQEPILVVTSPDMLRFWEKKLWEWAPDLNIVMYSSRTGKELVQQHEFALIENCLKMHVVVTTVDILSSDISFLQGFRWSALLIHDIRKLAFQELTKLSSNFRLICCPERSKIDTEALHHIAAFLGRDRNICLEDLVVCEYKAESSNVLREYWIPAQMPPVQIHQYCFLLTRNIDLLRSGSMSQGDMVLQDLVSRLRDCCNHPYLVSEPLEKAIEGLVPVTELLTAGIKASGKLEIMHRMLSRLHLNKKRTLIIVQFAKSKKLINIIDDYLRQQFPVGSYERIQRGMDPHAREAAIRRFNSPESSCVTLLLDRIASASVANQLTAVDAVFIYNSDWNPWNDTACVRKLGLNNASVYRLYSCSTLEEKILDGARQGIVMTDRPQTVKAFQEMIRWGASDLLQIDDWAVQNDAVADPRSGWSCAPRSDAVETRLAILTDEDVEALTSGNAGSGSSLGEKVRTILAPREASSRGAPLYGVRSGDGQDGIVSSDEFWSPLLKDRSRKPLEQRTRKPEHRHPEDAANKKRRKVAENDEESPAESPAKLEHAKVMETGPSRDHSVPELGVSPPAAAAASPSAVAAVASPVAHTTAAAATPVSQCSGGRATTTSSRSQRDEQMENLGELRTELRSLGEHLELPETVLDRALEMLAFVAKNLRLDSKFVHEVEMSLCWIAAEEMSVDFDKLAAISIAVGEGFDVDDDSLEAIRGKLKENLPARSAAKKASPAPTTPTPAPTTPTPAPAPAPAPGSTRPAAQVSPREYPPLDANDSGGCSLQVSGAAISVDQAELLENRKQELEREKSLRTQRLLNIQKEEWVAVFDKETKIKDGLGAEHGAERRRILSGGSPDPVATAVLLAERSYVYEVRLQKMMDGLIAEKSELGRLHRDERDEIVAMISSRLDQIRSGVLPDPLPPDTITNAAEARLRELQRNVANFSLPPVNQVNESLVNLVNECQVNRVIESPRAVAGAGRNRASPESTGSVPRQGSPVSPVAASSRRRIVVAMPAAGSTRATRRSTSPLARGFGNGAGVLPGSGRREARLAVPASSRTEGDVLLAESPRETDVPAASARTTSVPATATTPATTTQAPSVPATATIPATMTRASATSVPLTATRTPASSTQPVPMTQLLSVSATTASATTTRTPSVPTRLATSFPTTPATSIPTRTPSVPTTQATSVPARTLSVQTTATSFRTTVPTTPATSIPTRTPSVPTTQATSVPARTFSVPTTQPTSVPTTPATSVPTRTPSLPTTQSTSVPTRTLSVPATSVPATTIDATPVQAASRATTPEVEHRTAVIRSAAVQAYPAGIPVRPQSAAPPAVRPQSPATTAAVRPPLQQTVRPCDPLEFEETRLTKEFDKMKKAHDDEVAKLTRERDALMQRLDDEVKSYARKTEAFQSNLQRVAQHRRLSDALRRKDSVSITVRAPAAAAATAWRNSIMDFTAIANANTRPQALAAAPTLPYAVQQNRIQQFGQVPQQQPMLFAPPAWQQTPTSFGAPAAAQQPAARFNFAQPMTNPPAAVATAAAVAGTGHPPPPTVVATTQELMNARSQMMYRTIGESFLNPQAYAGGSGGNSGGGAVPSAVPGGALADVVVSTTPAPSRLGGGGGGGGGGNNAFFALDAPATLRQADFIYLSDDGD